MQKFKSSLLFVCLNSCVDNNINFFFVFLLCCSCPNCNGSLRMCVACVMCKWFIFQQNLPFICILGFCLRAILHACCRFLAGIVLCHLRYYIMWNCGHVGVRLPRAFELYNTLLYVSYISHSTNTRMPPSLYLYLFRL